MKTNFFFSKFILATAVILSFSSVEAQTFKVENSTRSKLEISLDIDNFSIEDTRHNGVEGQSIVMSGIFLPNNAGMPNLPIVSRYVAIPQGANISVNIKSQRSKSLSNIDLMPSPELPLDNDNSPIKYVRNEKVYTTNAYFPSEQIIVSEPMKIRDVDVVMLSLTPFQYNPVTKELIVNTYTNLEISFEDSKGDFGGDPRYRSGAWDHIINDLVLNSDALPKIDYQRFIKEAVERDAEGCEYLIITPNNPDFIQLADSIKLFRNQQGILTKTVTLEECGGNTQSAIWNYIHNAYTNWEVPVASVLLLGDHSENDTVGIVSYSMNNHPGGGGYNPYISDNKYGDMNGDHLPDVVIGRITGRNFDELYHMIDKDLQYERHPSTNPRFYNKPITAMGFQLERWFQLCSEIVNGFWEYELGKKPVRINAIYEGTPGSQWSTNENTPMIVNYFGENGLGYIPNTMSHLTEWEGKSQDINNAINAGAFIIQHRDHGAEELWGEPGYGIGSIKKLVNPDLTFVMSNNCLTGKFNHKGTDGCFAEAFHRHQYGALGLIAATEVSYSFVNDVYVWGVYDNMWPEFMPTYGTAHPTDFILPAYGNAAGKFFLQQSSWPTYQEGKEITHYLFHHHGDVYMNLYTEMPQNLSFSTIPAIVEGSTEFNITAEEDSHICLTSNGEIIGLGIGTGEPQIIEIAPQEVGADVVLTITKQNFFRVSEKITVISAEGPYIIYSYCELDDEKLYFNNETDVDVALHNVGFETINDLQVEMTTTSPYVEIISSSVTYNEIGINDTVFGDTKFRIKVSDDVPDLTKIRFNLLISNGTHSFTDDFVLIANAPSLIVSKEQLTDMEGNSIDRLQKGEISKLIITMKNQGHCSSNDIVSELDFNIDFVEINEPVITTEGLQPNDSLDVTFIITVKDDAPLGDILDGVLTYTTDGYENIYENSLLLGNTTENFESNELNPNLQWSNKGNYPWIQSDEDPYEGNYCYTSTSINYAVKSKLLLGVETEVADKISFYYKGSENQEDEFIFNINNKRYDLSGDEWQYFEEPLPVGKYVFKWIFGRKSDSGSGSASIDLIKLPPMHVGYTSIEEKYSGNEDDNIDVYPNPGNTELNIISQGNNTIQVFDCQGRMILEKVSDDVITTINTETWETGIYLIKIGKDTKKWLKF